MKIRELSVNKRRSIVNMRPLSNSHGFTLVELLVGLVLTLFIGAIALTYMVSSSESFKVQSNDSISQENARVVLELLAQNVRLAGLNPENDFDITLDGIYNGNTCLANSEASIANGQNAPCTVDELLSGSDRFAVDYAAAATAGAPVNITGCNGSNIAIPVGLTKRFINVFWTADLDNNGNGDGVRSLYCQTYNVTDRRIEGDAQPLIDGVDAIQVQYGVDSLDGSSQSDGVVDMYQSYTNLVQANPGNPTVVTRQVKAVRIALLVNAGVLDAGDARTEEVKERDYQLLDAPDISFNDGIFRQVYSTTIVVPNAL